MEPKTMLKEDSKFEDATKNKNLKAMRRHIRQLLATKSSDTAFLTLLSLQFELCSNAVMEEIALGNNQHWNFKMSRFITKRFNMLIKDEEETHSLNYDSIGLEKLLSSLEKVLTRAYNVRHHTTDMEIDPRLNPCLNMARSMMKALIHAYKFRNALSDIETILRSDRSDLPFYRCVILYTDCCDELDVDYGPRFEQLSP